MTKPEKQRILDRRPYHPSMSLIGDTVKARSAAVIANRALQDMKKKGQ